MIKVPNMIMIGASDRNAGKTEFVCELIRSFRSRRDTVAVKATVIREDGSACPRGGHGCGVCSSLEGGFEITDEVNAPAEKDTGRMAAAGPERVFWVRVKESAMNEAMESLLAEIGPDKVMICESNSLRNAVEPGVFVMIESAGSNEKKVSAERVARYVDRTVKSDGVSFDFDFELLSVVDGCWALRENASLIILTGGASSRMGSDKAMLDIGGVPLIRRIWERLKIHFDEVLLSGAGAQKYGLSGAEIVADRESGQGPLMGIASALDVSQSDLNLVVACDMPDISLPFARRMIEAAAGYDAVVPVHGDRLEPLFAVYRKSVAGYMDEALRAGERRVRSVFDDIAVNYIELPDSEWTRNINTQEDYADYGG